MEPHAVKALNAATITDVKINVAHNMSRTIDLDVDIGAEAVDYK